MRERESERESERVRGSERERERVKESERERESEREGERVCVQGHSYTLFPALPETPFMLTEKWA